MGRWVIGEVATGNGSRLPIRMPCQRQCAGVGATTTILTLLYLQRKGIGGAQVIDEFDGE